jgi:hypothetical protein
MSDILIKYHPNWDSELKIEGFAIMTLEQYTNWLIKFCKASNQYWCWNFGLNETICDWDAKNDFSVLYISEMATEIIKKVLNLQQFSGDYPVYGIFPTFEGIDDE